MQRVIERILNLLAYLLTVNHPVTADDIRNTVAGYDQETDAAFRRTFERDKDLLRSLGVPLTMGAMDVWEVEHGYVIPPGEYAIADPGLTEEERSALMVAAQAVQFAGQTTGLSAIFKLGGASPVLDAPNIGADLGHDLSTLGILFGAIASQTVVEFDYSHKKRRAKPYALAHRFGHWYLAAPEVGVDGVVKAFRVDRMDNLVASEDTGAFTRPPDFDPAAVIPTGGNDGQPTAHATVEFDLDVAQIVPRQISGASVVAQDAKSTTYSVPIRSEQSFIGWVLSFDDKAAIIEPEHLRLALVGHVAGGES
jgi:predicted DNA-binding transcriptional regulator YafY